MNKGLNTQNVENKILLKKAEIDNPQLSEVIKLSIGCPTKEKILEVIQSYQHLNNELLGAFQGDRLIGIAGLETTGRSIITIRHFSVLPEFQGQGIGTLLLNNVKEQHTSHKIVVETDEESIGFYLKSGFACNSFHGKYGNLRYSCNFS